MMVRPTLSPEFLEALKGRENMLYFKTMIYDIHYVQQ